MAEQKELLSVLGYAAGYGSVGAIALGLLSLAASLGGYALLFLREIALGRFFGLSRRRIQISRLGHDDVTLSHIAPEFAEAYRIHQAKGHAD
jgi:hypothetical protein